MAVNPDAHWYPLVVTTRLPVHSPPLLIQRSFTNNTYSVHLTDLTYIWGETLSRREIVQRALNDDTSIDPSEDASQMRILLAKLKEAISLRGEGNEENDDIDVDIQAVPERSSTSTGTLMQLKVTYDLPEPLQPLLWTFKLQPLPQIQLTKRLLLPLLSLSSLHSTEIQSLVRIIKDKDVVLEKMHDSLEDSKVSVAGILGGGASRRRGLEKFEEKIWRSHIWETHGEGISRPEKVVKRLFDAEDRRMKTSTDYGGVDQEWEEVVSKIEEKVNNSEYGKNWWDEIEAAPKARGNKKKKSSHFESDESESELPEGKATSKRGDRDDSRHLRESSLRYSSRINDGKVGMKGKKRASPHSEDEDEFEVQKTPPPRSRLTSKVKSPPPERVPVSRTAKTPLRKVEESTTEEDDDLDIPAPARTGRAKTTTPAPPKLSPPREFTKASSPPSPLPPPRDVSYSTESRANLGISSKPRSGSSTPPHDSLSPAQARQGGKSGRIVGTIGGKKEEAPQPPSSHLQDVNIDEDKTSDEEEKKPAKENAPLGKIGGRIGGKIGRKIGGKQDAKENISGVEASNAAKKFELPTRGGTPQALREIEKEAPPKREPSHDPMDEEAADKKRRQLQLELEAKQRVPAKKKRKF